MKGLLRIGCALVFISGLPSFAQVTVATHHYDNSRTGVNSEETTLTTSNVNTKTFGMLGSYQVDGQVYAQPLYIPDVQVSGKGTFNVLYVATMNNSIYAFNADVIGQLLWQKNFNNSSAGVTPVPYADVENPGETDINGPIGILSTPAIDVANNTLYAVVRTKENGSYVQRLHAIDIRSGSDLSNSPTVITASSTTSSGAVVTFNAKTQNQRVPLVVANGYVYITWASHNDIGPYHGWVMAYNTAQKTNGMKQAYVLNDTLNGNDGGIWQAGSAPVIDGTGNLYYLVGNGDWDGAHNYGQSVIKLSPTLKVVDYFTPDNWQVESNDDNDLGCGGLLMIPGTNLIVNGSKQGILYLTNSASLGHLVSGNTQIPQIFQAANGHIHSGPTYYDSPTLGPLVFIWSEGDYLKAFKFTGTSFNTTPVSKSAFEDPPGMPGGFMAVSSNGSKAGTGILWVNVPYSGDANHATVPGVLRAFDPNNLSTELWDSHMNDSRDDFGNFAKDVPPVVVNGKVYMATFSNTVAVYGLLSTPVNEIQIDAGGPASGTYVADTYCSGGNNSTTSNTINTSSVSNPAPVVAYQDQRWGPTTCTIPNLTPNASYDVRLHFAETYWTATGKRLFNVAINGSQVLSNFDITAAAGAANKAVAETFSTSANSSGQVVIQFTNGSADNAAINAIEVSNQPFLQTVQQINAGGAATGTFSADSNFVGGATSYTDGAINLSGVSNAAPQAVYQTDRWGVSTYTVPDLTPGKQYTVRLHFAEYYWTKAGQRRFNVAINGANVLSNFDIFATAGASFKAVVEQFSATANSSGNIVISFTQGSADQPKVSGIEVH